MVEITAKEWNKGRRTKRIEDSLRDLWDDIKCNNIRIIGYPEEEKKEESEKICEEIIVKNFPNMGKEIVKVQEVQRVPYRIKPRRNTLRYIPIKIAKIKHKERILKAAKEKQQVTYKGKPICLTADLSAETLLGKGKIYNQDYSTWQGSHSKVMEKSKALQTSKS